MGGAAIRRQSLLPSADGLPEGFRRRAVAAQRLADFGLRPAVAPGSHGRQAKGGDEGGRVLAETSQGRRVAYPAIAELSALDLAMQQMISYDGKFAPGGLLYFELKGTPRRWKSVWRPRPLRRFHRRACLHDHACGEPGSGADIDRKSIFHGTLRPASPPPRRLRAACHPLVSACRWDSKTGTTSSRTWKPHSP